MNLIPINEGRFLKIMSKQKKKFETISRNGHKTFVITRSQYDFYHQVLVSRKRKSTSSQTFVKPMSDSRFLELHKLYMQEKFQSFTKATFQGKYILICFDEVVQINKKDSTKYKIESANTVKLVKEMLAKHEGHNYILVHQSKAKKYGIKRNNVIWRDLI